MKIYCINLDRRVDRWNECLEIFSKHNMSVERFSGVDGNPGYEKLNGATDGDIGCTLSHYELVKKLKAEGIKEALILEDDVELIDNFMFYFNNLINTIKRSKIEYDMIWLGGNHVIEPTIIEENIAKVNKTYTTHAYVITEKVYDDVIRIHGQGQKQVDVYYNEIQATRNCLVFLPSIAWQRGSYSDIQNQYVNYEFLKPMIHESIDGWFDFNKLYDRMINEVSEGHFVEVGSWLGKSACYMAEMIKRSGKHIAFDCVDLWSLEGNDPWYKQAFEKYGNIFEIFQTNISKTGYKVGIKRMPSVEAAKLYENESLDFVFIDANHQYKWVKEDIQAWLPKVKKGGYIGGHDYSDSDGHKGVVQAVNESFENFEILETSWLVKI